MSLFNFFKNLLGNGAHKVAAEIPENHTMHPAPEMADVPGNLFKKELQSNPNAVLLDVRTRLEVRGGALPEALHLDVLSASFAQKVAQLDKSKTYLVYCRSGNRSGQACRIMHQQGFDVRNLIGGMGAFPRN